MILYIIKHILYKFQNVILQCGICCRNIAFIAGAGLAVLLILTVYDEDVLTVEHLFSIMTVLGGVVAGSRQVHSQIILS